MNSDNVRASKRLSRWLRQKLLHKVTPIGFTPINEFAKDDIFVVGYPKSGNTWFQALVAGAVHGVLPELVPMSVIKSLVPDVHDTRWYQRHGTPMFFKSHHVPQPQYRRVIYLLRDGRDAMVSYHHYQQAVAGKQFDFMEFMRNDIFPCKWHKHVEAWLDNPFKAEMITVRYEELKADPVKQLKRVCAFADIERRDEILQLAADSASFKKMQSKEKVEGPFATNNWPKDKLFCRRGSVGGYREEMPREVLELFMQESASMLRQCGYQA